MGIHTMGSQGREQQSHVQPLTRKNSWYNLTLDEVGHQLEELGKPLGSMNLDELLTNVWSTEEYQTVQTDADNDTSLQRQASLSLARALSEKTVDEVWEDIQSGQRKKFGESTKSQGRESTLGEMTLEDFLIKAAVFAEGLDTPNAMTSKNAVHLQRFPPEMELSTYPLIGAQAQSNALRSERKKDALDALEKTVDRRLKRKIKNRESAARSRARKQAYHNELVNKISCLEKENIRLKKEKELEMKLLCEASPFLKYQLRRTSSAAF